MSGRIRSVKPEWLEDEPLVALSSDARVLSVALLLLADDYGNGRAGELYLASRVFPGRPAKLLRAALAALVTMTYVVLYDVAGQRYFHVRNWGKHQKVQNPGKPLVPEYVHSPETDKPSNREGGTGAIGPPETLRRLSGDSPETLTPDRDMDQRPTIPTTTTTGPPPGVAVGSTVDESEPDPGRQTLCPTDLADRLETNGTLRRLAEQLPAPFESVRACARGFVATWTIGKLAGQKRGGWAGRCRQWVIDQHAQGKLRPPGAVEHEARSGAYVPPDDGLAELLAKVGRAAS